MEKERRKQPASEIYIAVLFCNEITQEELDFLSKLPRVHRVFIATDVNDNQWDNELSTNTGYRADRINLLRLKDLSEEMRDESIADIVQILTMRGHPKKHVYLHHGPNIEKYNLNLENIKKTLEKDKDTEAFIE